MDPENHAPDPNMSTAYGSIGPNQPVLDPNVSSDPGYRSVETNFSSAVSPIAGIPGVNMSPANYTPIGGPEVNSSSVYSQAPPRTSPSMDVAESDLLGNAVIGLVEGAVTGIGNSLAGGAEYVAGEAMTPQAEIAAKEFVQVEPVAEGAIAVGEHFIENPTTMVPSNWEGPDASIPDATVQSTTLPDASVPDLNLLGAPVPDPGIPDSGWGGG